MREDNPYWDLVIVYDGQDITRWSIHQRARHGLLRSFQITRLFKSLTVLENMAFAVQAAQGHIFSAWSPLARDAALTAQARAGLWMALHYVPIALLALSFRLQEMSQFEIPRWPRKPRLERWREPVALPPGTSTG